MGRLVAIEARGQVFCDELRRAWDRGDAVLPLDPRLPAAATERLVHAMAVGEHVEDGVALVLATSGTTGMPKGVAHTHDGIAASAAATSAHLGIDPGRHRWLACLPLAHIGGLSVVTRAWHTATPVDVHDEFDAAAVDAAGAAGATHVSLVGTALARIDPTRWERIVLGGSAPPPGRPANTVATYGSTETGSGIVYDGVALPGVEIRVVPGPDDVDGVGEIVVRGAMVARAYRDGSSIVDDDGWFATGDVGRLDAGVLDVHGRRGDLIITGGENVAPDPVEAVLRRHPAIVDAAIVGVADPEWGQRVVAVIVTAGDGSSLRLEDVREHVKAELPVWNAPKALVVVDELPRTTLGKLRRQVVRDALDEAGR